MINKNSARFPPLYPHLLPCNDKRIKGGGLIQIWNKVSLWDYRCCSKASKPNWKNTKPDAFSKSANQAAFRPGSINKLKVMFAKITGELTKRKWCFYVFIEIIIIWILITVSDYEKTNEEELIHPQNYYIWTVTTSTNIDYCRITLPLINLNIIFILF